MKIQTCDAPVSSESRRLSHIWFSFVAAIKAQHLRYATERKLNFLGDRELADIGLCRSDIPKLARLGPTELPLIREEHQANYRQPDGAFEGD
ncbi:DUF1127 domain-containing protein [Nitratireductor sp. ZSWI3]|uniref:DUF1127 domain-containing protein n=1 Tax=Nitratireductor sp. ZSWI3 TaxID=2966359 RepID=UPI00214FB747|nr:DUF1127 domain-containing protein [Nitratireductor sp. ZSWI3]MCR4267710.1 DUF1127 domain-containing protein [Nitratireductor sp. ZSWI3]